MDDINICKLCGKIVPSDEAVYYIGTQIGTIDAACCDEHVIGTDDPKGELIQKVSGLRLICLIHNEVIDELYLRIFMQLCGIPDNHVENVKKEFGWYLPQSERKKQRSVKYLNEWLRKYQGFTKNEFAGIMRAGEKEYNSVLRGKDHKRW